MLVDMEADKMCPVHGDKQQFQAGIYMSSFRGNLDPSLSHVAHVAFLDKWMPVIRICDMFNSIDHDSIDRRGNRGKKKSR